MIRSHWRLGVLCLIFGVLLTFQPSLAVGPTVQKAGQAPPDECWLGCGEYQAYTTDFVCTQAGGIPKRNQAYPWGMFKVDDTHVWFGTGPNIAVLAQSAGGLEGFSECEYSCRTLDRDACKPGQPNFESDVLNVVEGANSTYPVAPVLTGIFPTISPIVSSILGDWRPPEVWVYDIQSKTATKNPVNPTVAPLLNQTLGLRAVGALNHVVILAGPSKWGYGVNMFAFRDDGTYLGSQTFVQYSDIRKFLVANNVLYAGVQTTDAGGAILRWNGSDSNPFNFTVVGVTDNNVAYLAFHNKRLYAGTWNPKSVVASLAGTFIQQRPQSGIYMSPQIPSSGLRWYHSLLWKKVWQVTDYEPDEVVGTGTAVGDMVSSGDYLYWGNMVPPFQIRTLIEDNYGTAAMNSFTARKIAIFRAKDFATSSAVELLYGEPQLSRYSGSGWEDVENNMEVDPLLGYSGFSNGLLDTTKNANTYTWSMVLHKGKVYVGTLEQSNPQPGVNLRTDHRGGDLWVFNHPNYDSDQLKSDPAQAVTLDGFATLTGISDLQYTVEGMRNMVSVNNTLVVGASSKANLDDLGGWKLFAVTP